MTPGIVNSHHAGTVHTTYYIRFNIQIIRMVQLNRCRRMSVLVLGMTAFMAGTFNVTSMFKFGRYLPGVFTEHVVSKTGKDSMTAPALNYVESSRNASSVVPVSKDPATPLSTSRNRVPSSSRSRSKNTTVTDVAVVTVTDAIDVIDSITIQNSLCGGCRLSIIDPGDTCGDHIESLIFKSHKNSSITDLTLVQAAVQVAAMYSEHCSRCDPTACSSSEKVYWHDLFSSVTDTNTVSTPTAPIQDSLCGGCRLAVIKSNNPLMTCGDRIQHFVTRSHKNWTLVQAAIQVAAVYPEKCSRCDPTACSEADKMYWRFDQKSPVINHGRTHMLSSIPAANRIPASALADLPNYFSDPANVRGTEKKYLFEYNPSIVLLPPDQIPASLVVAPGNSDGGDDDQSNNNTAVYMASYRVSDINMCLPNGAKYIYNPNNTRPAHEEYLGIAFLRADLSIIRDFTVDLRTANVRVQDFRLFNLAGNLYITGYEVIAPVWVNVPADIAQKNKRYMKKLYDMFQKEEDRTENDLTLSVRTFTSCCSSPSCTGKNFNYFVGSGRGSGGNSSNTSHNNASSATKIMVDTNPMFPHTVDEVDLNRRCDAAKEEGKDNSVNTIRGPAPSHYSNMERLFFEKGHYAIQQSGDRGTAGFVKLEILVDDNNDNNKTGQTSKSQQLLLGVSHQKLFRFGDFKVEYSHATYTSNFYAFEQTPPYRVVARSGAFCMGFPSEEENEQNFYSRLVRSRPLIMGEKENCPQVGFVSGITEKAGDDSKVIIGYGINDCVPRVVEIDKSEIVRLLFNPTAAGTNSL
jgi:hypothetical protein